MLQSLNIAVKEYTLLLLLLLLIIIIIITITIIVSGSLTMYQETP
jgi:hypothetical protein